MPTGSLHLPRPGNTCCSVLWSRATGTTSSSQAMLCNIHHCFNKYHEPSNPTLVLNHFNFMYQAKTFAAETLFVPYFSPLGPPSHSPCPLVSAVTITFLLEPPAWNETSSSGPPSGNTNRLFRNFSQNPSLQHWYWQVVPGWRVLYTHIVSEAASLLALGDKY